MTETYLIRNIKKVQEYEKQAKSDPFTQADCTNAMHLRQLLTEMVIILTILTLPEYSIHGSAEKKISQYPWMPKTSTHITPYKISGDI
ncbi:uncharacterized protein Dyak_GE27451 [Drosophila yakuba]|uniref:Uncharacterized protein n=2 Tax=Drosophila yakuba TaxID=7245 RepID=A0A0R1DTR0_DROYA|nr:uncharacterized protein Dyak_GE27451 [Drosophila yakuba]